jgi:ABC-type dipeptide/oligopeptide/nickel transport system permease subunit
MRIIAASILLVLTLAAAVVIVRSPFRYDQQDRDNINIGATHQHWTGTDDLGRDRTVRLAGALLLGLLGAAAASAIASGLAVGAGLGAAFAPNWLGRTILYLSDVALTLPWLFLLMMVRASLPLNLAPIHSATLTFLLLGLLGWPAFVRANHARARTLRGAEWLVHGRASGLRPLQLGRQLLPHLAPLLLTQFLIYIPVCIVAEANLGAMGLGIGEPLPSWGSMLLALQHAALTANTHWMYLPIVLLVGVLLLLEAMLVEV